MQTCSEYPTPSFLILARSAEEWARHLDTPDWISEDKRRAKKYCGLTKLRGIHPVFLSVVKSFTSHDIKRFCIQLDECTLEDCSTTTEILQTVELNTTNTRLAFRFMLITNLLTVDTR